jgi:PIN domain nuclease of toxin-antitoxin system
MRLLLDTHVLLWWHDQPARLTETAYNVISDLGNDVFLSVVSGWEIQIKTQLGKLTLSKPLRVLLQEEEATNGFRGLPVTLEHVYALDRFPLHHRDPFDRLLIAQAHQEGLTLVTHDPKFSVYAVPLLGNVAAVTRQP